MPTQNACAQPPRSFAKNAQTLAWSLTSTNVLPNVALTTAWPSALGASCKRDMLCEKHSRFCHLRRHQDRWASPRHRAVGRDGESAKYLERTQVELWVGRNAREFCGSYRAWRLNIVTKIMQLWMTDLGWMLSNIYFEKWSSIVRFSVKQLSSKSTVNMYMFSSENGGFLDDKKMEKNSFQKKWTSGWARWMRISCGCWQCTWYETVPGESKQILKICDLVRQRKTPKSSITHLLKTRITATTTRCWRRVLTLSLDTRFVTATWIQAVEFDGCLSYSADIKSGCNAVSFCYGCWDYGLRCECNKITPM